MMYVVLNTVLLKCHCYIHLIQVNAPTCPVIVVGTHLDHVDAKQVPVLKQLVDTLYGDTLMYPKIAAIACVSCTTFKLQRNSDINILRKQIYFAATHLFLDYGKGNDCKFLLLGCVNSLHVINNSYLHIYCSGLSAFKSSRRSQCLA